jgi:dTDP-4-amino-4,6-dideoxygalactose transaminase
MNEYLTALCERVSSTKIEKPIPVGQLYFPDWERYEETFRDIFEREYYNNNGPLLTLLENKLQQYLGVKHVICTSNATMGLMIAAQALELSGKVILPAHTFIASAQSLKWAGLEPVFCDVDSNTHHIDVSKIEALIDENVSAIMAVNLWGGASEVSALEALANKHSIKLYFDSAQAFGCWIKDKAIGNFGDLEVFSFHATKILSAGEGGCICTNNDGLAARIKSIRPSYGVSTSVNIIKVANARMSEAQAAIALLSFDDFEKNKKNNFNLFNQYKKRLAAIEGIELKQTTGVTCSNFQSVVCQINESIFGISRNRLIELLKTKNILARRYFYPGTHKTIEFKSTNFELPITDYLSESCIQLPIGAFVDIPTVDTICDVIELIQKMPQFFDSVMSETKK